ncbi:hypothetical protein OG900_12190 [Streptomyces sp. NBC_00433]
MGSDSDDGTHTAGTVEPFALPILGTTWVDRGSRYWTRRSWLFLRSVPFVALGSFGLGAFYAAFVSFIPQPARTVVHIVEGAAAVAALGVGWVRERRVRDVPVMPEEIPGQLRRSRANAERGRNMGALVMVFAPVAPGLIAYLLGVWLASVFVRVTRRELGARLDYDRRLAAATAAQVSLAKPPAPRNGPTRR